MNRGSIRSGGYTIVETLIFLAVSGMMVISAVLLVSGQQGKTEFAQTVQDFSSQLQDISNDVSTGYSAFPFDSDRCRIVGAGGRHIVHADPTGGDDTCIFIGRVLQFVPDGYRTISVVGQRTDSSGKEVTNLATAGPLALAPGSGPSGSVGNYSQSRNIGPSATIQRVTYNDAASHDIAAFGFFSTFQQYSGAVLASGSLGVDVVALNGLTLSPAATLAQAVDVINGYPADYVANPKNGFVVCLRSNASNQIAYVSVGGTDAAKGLNTGRLTVSSRIQNGSVCT